MRSRSAVMDTSFKVSITVLTHRRYNTCRVSGLVQIAIALIYPGPRSRPNLSVSPTTSRSLTQPRPF